MTKFNIILPLAALELAIWCTPGTIAIRYLLGLIILIATINLSIATQYLKQHRIIFIFAIYVALHSIFIASDPTSAMRTAWGEWGIAIIYSLVGYAAAQALPLQERLKSIFIFGVSLSAPSVILLIQYISATTQPSLGFIGMFTSHGDIAYSSLASLPFLTYAYSKSGSQRIRYSAIVISAIELAALFISQSRGGMAFAILAVFATLLFVNQRDLKHISIANRKHIFASISVFILVLLGISFSPRFAGTLERMSASFLDDPINMVCNGAEHYKDHNASHESITGINSDGGRIIVARASIALLTEEPLGSGASKSAYWIQINNHCTPKIGIVNAHNGWLNTALSIGLPGAVVLLAIYLYFGIPKLRSRAKALSTQQSEIHALLSAIVVLWGIRNIVDSAQQDHMLEMQFFIFSFLLAIGSKEIIAHPSSDRNIC